MKIIKFFALVSACFWAVGCGMNLDRGLVLHSDFEHDARDLGPNHYDGFLRSNAVISDDCAVGESSVYLDGQGAYVEYPEGKTYFDGDYSISIWAKWEKCNVASRILDFNQVMPMAGNAITWFIGLPEEGTSNNLWLEQWIMVDGAPVRSERDIMAVPSDAYLGYNVTTDRWDHYVIVYNSSARNPLGNQVNSKDQKIPYRGKVTLYVNGVKVGENYHCLKPQPVPTVANWLGRSRYVQDPRFQGWLDDFRIYDRKLSEKEVQALYDLGES
ncbi:MAG: LamG domain-containing protein [Bacteroidales bacterium]|nr:LamG domain-containing protein [Bacteroidales bacterium]